MVAEAFEPARRVRQHRNGILVADLALQSRADEGARGLGGIEGGTAAAAPATHATGHCGVGLEDVGALGMGVVHQ